MTTDTETLTKLLAEATPGPWVTSETTIHGVKYGGAWVQGADQPDDDGLMKPPLICISGSGGSRSFTTRIVERQDHDDNDANARLIALAPTLAAELIEARAEIGLLRADLAAERASGDALVACAAYQRMPGYDLHPMLEAQIAAHQALRKGEA